MMNRCNQFHERARHPTILGALNRMKYTEVRHIKVGRVWRLINHRYFLVPTSGSSQYWTIITPDMRSRIFLLYENVCMSLERKLLSYSRENFVEQIICVYIPSNSEWIRFDCSGLSNFRASFCWFIANKWPQSYFTVKHRFPVLIVSWTGNCTQKHYFPNESFWPCLSMWRHFCRCQIKCLVFFHDVKPFLIDMNMIIEILKTYLLSDVVSTASKAYFNLSNLFWSVSAGWMALLFLSMCPFLLALCKVDLLIPLWCATVLKFVRLLIWISDIFLCISEISWPFMPQFPWRRLSAIAGVVMIRDDCRPCLHILETVRELTLNTIALSLIHPCVSFPFTDLDKRCWYSARRSEFERLRFSMLAKRRKENRSK